MLKFKKILSSFTCILLLLAFFGAAGFVTSQVSSLKIRTEVSPASFHTAMDISLLSEERDDATDHYAAVILAVMFFGLAFIFLINFQTLAADRVLSLRPALQNNLYIGIRSLRF